MQWEAASPPFHRTSLDTTSFRESFQTIASRALTGYSQCPGRTVIGMPKRLLLLASVILASLATLTSGQTPAPAKKLPAGPPAPQSTHYPILLLAVGNNPIWSLRIGQKGPERLDRTGYPPIPLEPAEVTHEAALP